MCTKYSVIDSGSVFNMVTYPTKSHLKKFMKKILISGTKKVCRKNVKEMCIANYFYGNKVITFD